MHVIKNLSGLGVVLTTLGIIALAVAGRASAAPERKTGMPRFMDFHENLKLPPEAVEQIADDTRNERADQFGVRQVALGVDCGAVHRVDGIT